MPNQAATASPENVFDIRTGKTWSETSSERFIRLSPEMDGLEMLYTNELHPEKLFSVKILCWGLRANGDIVGLAPWLDRIQACPEINDPLHGTWQGYYDPGIEEVFFDPPEHKVLELDGAAEYYQYDCHTEEDVIQEIPDVIGTHAVLSDDGFSSITLSEVVSWELRHNGDIIAMLIDEEKVTTTPVLPGDDCLYPAYKSTSFQYFFQHNIANKLKKKDPEAIAAIAMLLDRDSE